MTTPTDQPRKKHRWDYSNLHMDTPAGKRLGGFATCFECGLMRFSRPGRPPTHHYVTRSTFDAHHSDDTIKPGADCVLPTAPPCSRWRGHKASAILVDEMQEAQPPTAPRNS